MQFEMQYMTVVFGRSFPGHPGGVEHVSFDGDTIIGTSVDV